MASTNGARKAPKNANSNSSNKFKYTKLGLVAPARYDSIFTEDDEKPVKLKIKHPLPKQSVPGNWSEENVVTGGRTKKVKEDKTPSSPLMKPLVDKIARGFPSGTPFGDTQETMMCKHCKRPVLKGAMGHHVQDCLKKKQEKQQKKKEAKEAKDAALRKEKNGGVSPAPSVDESVDNKRARKTAIDIGDGTAKKSGKKRKADDEPKGASAKKKKKEDTKAKAAKAKGPVDVEKQCGVLLNNGAMCARSLTCKSHSMGAKRSVPGRSMPYDVLLAQYQKKNQAKQQRAAIDANAPLADEFEPPGTVDSDEEREAVMAAISRSYHTNPYTGSRLAGAPILSYNLVAPTTKYKYHRMKDMLRNALSGENGRHLFATPGSQAASAGIFGGPTDGGMGQDGFDLSRRASSVTAGRQMLPGSRKPSISGQL